ncbi:MAG: HD-GYP domain-containing protein, partial [Planctomycetota bacterium]
RSDAQPLRPADERRIRRDLAALYKIGNVINAQESPRKLLAVVMDTVLDVIRAERGFLLLADADSGEVAPRVIRVRPGSGADPDLPVSRPIVQEAMEQGVAVLCPDLKAEERYCDGDAVLLDHIRSVACAPLETGDEVLGAVYLDTATDAARFSEHDLELLTAIARQAALALHRAQLIEELEQLFVRVIETLVATVEAKDIYTYGHSARVSKLARQIARRLGLDEEALEQLKVAGLLHDVGKIGIPQSILGKPGRLTDEEWEYIRSHPQIGEGIIRQLGSPRLAEIQRTVRHHHEKIDGSGYPDGLAGEAIPLMARILAVADAYDAMTSNRPYRAPLSTEAAVEELQRGAGSQFDAAAVEALVAERATRPAVAAEAASGEV